MLVLSRKERQRVQIGEDVTLIVLSVHGNSIRLGIEAPLEVPVHRAEVAARLVEEPTPGKQVRTIPKSHLVG